jgi:Zn-dependent protease
VTALLTGKVRLFRVLGIDVYVHALFIIVAGFELLRGVQKGHVPWTLTWLGALWVSVLLHEFGHCWGARRVGGDAHEVLLWPLGGLALVDAPMTPRAQFVTTACGPLVNLILGGLGLAIGRFALGYEVQDLLWGYGLEWRDYALPVFVNANAALFLFNMVPAFPMDMGRIFQVVLWTRLGFQRAMRIAVYVSFVCAGALVIVGLTETSSVGSGLTILVGLFVIQGAYRELQLVRSGAYAELDEPWRQTFLIREAPRSEPGFLARWSARRREARARAQAEEEAARTLKLDDVLRRVAAVGMDGLSPEERKFLDLESARLRSQKRPSGD